jgi:hypothetical protein
VRKINIDKSFFAKERTQSYSDWRAAFWRELLANSLDPGVNTTQIFVTETPGEITFSDNGTGMSRDVAENIYMTLGRSSKDMDSEGIGGFGRARILTCFAMDSYTIQSRDYKIDGQADSWSIEELPRPIEGFSLIVRDSSAFTNMRRKLEQVLGQSWLPNVEIYYNNERLYNVSVTVQSDEAVPLTLADGEEIATARLAHVPAGPAGYAIVRVNGLAMFTSYIGLGGTSKSLLVELTPEKSREHLTANRDGPKPALASAISTLSRAIGTQGESAAKRKKLVIRRELVGRKGLRTTRSGIAALRSALQLSAPNETERSPGFSARSATLVAERERRNFSLCGHTMSYCVEATEEAQIEAGLAWDPERWLPLGFEAPSARAKWRLLAVWEEAVERALKALLDFNRTSVEIRWSIGIAVGDFEARCVSVGWGTSTYFEINPVTAKGLGAFDFTQPKTFRRLLAIALHEVVHVVCEDHDANFAGLLTELFSEIDIDEALKAMRAHARRWR